jgi:hypothetical protein
VDGPAGPGSREGDSAQVEASPADADEAPGSDARPAVASLDALGAEPRVAWSGGRTQADPAWSASARSRVALPAAESVALPAAESVAAVNGGAGAEVWSSGLPAADPAGASRAAATNASWSLSGGKDRWVGASLTASPPALTASPPALTASPPALARANIGVMVQLDLGKALGKL